MMPEGFVFTEKRTAPHFEVFSSPYWGSKSILS